MNQYPAIDVLQSISRLAPVFLRRKTRFDQFVICVLDNFFALRTEDSHQSLCKDTIEGGDEAVGIHLHVKEPADDIEDIVGMHSRKNQMSC